MLIKKSFWVLEGAIRKTIKGKASLQKFVIA